uniref:Venom protein family 2 protein 7 n=1 Tax=Platymeris rhadamanthus TaxID=1134088 RepID=A0A6B9L3H9_PLARH|nr:venom protein family 2 protein 7 [Platymeris rhadamanthus]
MKLLMIIFLSMAATVLAVEKAPIPAIPVVKKPSVDVTKQVIEELRHMKTSKFLTLNLQPKCNEEESFIECCIKFKLIGVIHNVCTKVLLSPKKVDATFELHFDGRLVFSRDLTVGQVCAPLPGKFGKLTTCVDAYYVNVDNKPPSFSFDACFIIKLAGIVKFEPNCIRLDKDGILTQHV